jgi:hypothetical protein
MPAGVTSMSFDLNILDLAGLRRRAESVRSAEKVEVEAVFRKEMP